MATLAEIADHAGVSQATVSRVLNGKAGVSADSRRQVLVALDVLGYERPAQLRQRRDGLVGLVVPELENPIFPAYAQAIETLLSQKGFTPVLCTQSPGGVAEDEYLESLLDHGVAGIIFVSGRHADAAADHDRYRALIDRHLPVVFINGFAPDVPAPFFSDDDAEAMTLAVGHLAQLGHTRIGLAMGQERFVPAQRKKAAFVTALRRQLSVPKREALQWVEHSLFTVEGGEAAAGPLLDRGATAIVCGSDLMALGAVRAARRRRLRVPRDVSVVGYDDSPLLPFMDPPLTTVRQDVSAIGTAAVTALIDAIAGAPVPDREYLYRPDLVLRGSTAAAPEAR